MSATTALTKPELARLGELLERRTAALAARGPALTPAVSRERERAEAEILAHLLASPGPVTVGGVRLHLTYDKLHFVELDAATGIPLYADPGEKGRPWRSLLYRYPKTATRRTAV